MNLEDRLSEALHSDLDSRRPPPELAYRIAQALQVQPSPTRRWPGFRPAARSRLAAGIVAVSLLAVLAPAALLWAPGPLAGPRDLTPTPPPSGLAHFGGGGLAFDYPAGWRSWTPGPKFSNGSFLGTGSASASCLYATPYANDEPPVGSEYCGIDLRIEPGQVVVELSSSFGPPVTEENYGSSNMFVTVGGLPAIRHNDEVDATDGANSMAWTLSIPQDASRTYRLTATMKGPGLEELRAQVLALVASIEYDPPVPVLDPKDGPQAAARGLNAIRTGMNEIWGDQFGGPGYECFDNVPGAAATATITQDLWSSATLRKPLPVTCSMAIEPHFLGLWKMTLTWSWTAAFDRSAGMATQTVWLKPDGEALVGIEGFSSGLPYLP